MRGMISDPVTRLDAAAKIGGAAKYISDMDFEGLLYARVLRSVKAHARIIEVKKPVLPEGYYYVMQMIFRKKEKTEYR